MATLLLYAWCMYFCAINSVILNFHLKLSYFSGVLVSLNCGLGHFTIQHQVMNNTELPAQ